MDGSLWHYSCNFSVGLKYFQNKKLKIFLNGFILRMGQQDSHRPAEEAIVPYLSQPWDGGDMSRAPPHNTGMPPAEKPK